MREGHDQAQTKVHFGHHSKSVESLISAVFMQSVYIVCIILHRHIALHNRLCLVSYVCPQVVSAFVSDDLQVFVTLRTPGTVSCLYTT